MLRGTKAVLGGTRTHTQTLAHAGACACACVHTNTHTQTHLTHARANTHPRVHARGTRECCLCVGVCVRATRVCGCECVCVAVSLSPSLRPCSRARGAVFARPRACAGVRQRPCGCVALMCALVRANVCVHVRARAPVQACCVCVCGTTACVRLGAVRALWRPAVLIARPAAPGGRACAVAVTVRPALGVARVRRQV